MDAFFDKTYKLAIGQIAPAGSLNIALSIEPPFRMTFDITKTELSEPNTATITIDNLSKDTRALLRSDRKLVVELRAGYKEYGGSQLLFAGDVVDIYHTVSKPEVVTTIIAHDGYKVTKTKQISVSYRKGTPLKHIIDEAIGKLGIPKNASYSFVQLPTNSTDGTMVYTGSCADWLDKLCFDNGLQWSVQNNTVKIYQDTKTDNLPALKSILIGSPKRINKDQTAVDAKDFTGWEFDALLMPKCEPGSAVTLQSNEIPKPLTLKASEVSHKGDNYGDSWTTTVKARDL